MEELTKNDSRIFFDIPFRDTITSVERMKVIAVSVRIEAIVSKAIGRVLGFSSLEQTRSFGNTSNALSFNAKINLFLDTKEITKEQVNILTKFSEIRNKFAHVEAIETIYDCLEVSDKSVRKFLEKTYSAKVENYEYGIKDCYQLFLLFLDDVEHVCSTIFKAMINAILKENEKFIKAKKAEILRDTLIDKSLLTAEQADVVEIVIREYLKRVAEFDFEEDAPPIL